jgi:hypothetical protein
MGNLVRVQPLRIPSVPADKGPGRERKGKERKGNNYFAITGNRLGDSLGRKGLKSFRIGEMWSSRAVPEKNLLASISLLPAVFPLLPGTFKLFQFLKAILQLSLKLFLGFWIAALGLVPIFQLKSLFKFPDFILDLAGVILDPAKSLENLFFLGGKVVLKRRAVLHL